MVIAQSPDNFMIDGVSCESVGLYCDTPPVQTMAQTRMQQYDVGSDEDRIIDDDSFEDIQFQFNCYSFYPENFDTAEVYAYLRSGKKLTMSRNAGYFYRIKEVRCTASEKYDGKRLRYNVTFTVSPFRYIDNEQDIVLSSGEGTAVNGSGTRYSKPIYILQLKRLMQDSAFVVNGQGFNISIPLAETISGGKLYVDAENDIVYDANGNNRMMFTTGDIPYLSTEQNNISFSGDISGITIIRNGRCY